MRGWWKSAAQRRVTTRKVSAVFGYAHGLRSLHGGAQIAGAASTTTPHTTTTTQLQPQPQQPQQLPPQPQQPQQSQQLPHQSDTYAPGDFVLVHGLAIAAGKALNGQTGKVVKMKDATSGRYGIRLSGGAKAEKLFKEDNLKAGVEQDYDSSQKGDAP